MRKLNVLSVIPILFLLVAACTSPTPKSQDPAVPQASPTHIPEASRVNGTPTDIWYALFEHTPVPWTTPLPPLETTVLDATYVKINPRLATPFPCRRCPDYALEGGLWKFSLDKGVFRIFYSVNNWRSLGSYTVAGDRLYLFNDPYCHRDTGVYTWTLVDGTLSLTEMNDPCSQGLRAANLVDQPWFSCQPPNIEAKITDHWQKPEGCDPNG